MQCSRRQHQAERPEDGESEQVERGLVAEQGILDATRLLSYICRSSTVTDDAHPSMVDIEYWNRYSCLAFCISIRQHHTTHSSLLTASILANVLDNIEIRTGKRTRQRTPDRRTVYTTHL